jgi:hypothetical protein
MLAGDWDLIDSLVTGEAITMDFVDSVISRDVVLFQGVDSFHLIVKDPSESPASGLTIHTAEIEPGSVRRLFPRVRRLSPQEVSRCN